MVAVYADALAREVEVAKGLTTTHQGGDAYQADNMTLLRRFLILGSENGSFYVSAPELTAQNIHVVADALRVNARATIDTIVDISVSGRAPKQEPALLALAMAASFDMAGGTHAANVRNYALSQLPKVARIGTHKFIFADYVSVLRGWGTTLRRGRFRHGSTCGTE